MTGIEAAASRLPESYRTTSRLSGAMAIALGALVLVGWLFDIRVLMQVFPGQVAMVPNTAVAFIAAGLGLWCLAGAETPSRRYASLTASAVCVLLGLLVLAEYFADLSLDIDELLFRDRAGLTSVYPGRMAVLTAISFVAIGGAIITSSLRRGRSVGLALALIPASLALVSLVGYAYGVPSLFWIGRYKGMAIHTAAGFLFLSGGVLVLRANGLTRLLASNTAGGRLGRRVLPAAILSPLLLGWLGRLGEEAGLYPLDVVDAAVAVCNALVLLALLYAFAQRLRATDEARQRADASIQKLASAVEHARNAILITDPDGAITYANPAFEATYGYSRLETLGKTPRILKSGQQDQAFYADVWRRLLAGESVREEFVNKTRDGRLVTVENAVSPILDAEGRRIGFIAVQDDVTERKRAEAALRLSERRFRALVTHGLDFISLAAADGTLLWESPSMHRPLGYPQDAFLGRNLFELIHPDDADRVRQAQAQVVQQPAIPRNGEFRLRRQDGSWCWVEASANNLLDDESVQAIVINYRDITERKRAEAALRQSEILASSLVAHLPQRIFVKDRNSDYLFCNANYARSLGIDPLQIVGKDDFAFHRAELAEKYRADDGKVMADGKALDIEEPYTISGQERWAHTLKVPYRDEQGEVIGVVGVFEDITERKHAADDLRARVREAAFVADVATALTEAEDLQTALHRTADAMVRHLDAAVAQVWLLDEAHTELALAATAGAVMLPGEITLPVPLGQFKIGRIAAEQRPLLSNDIARDRGFRDASWALDRGCVSFAGHPLVVNNRVVGVTTMLARHPLSDSTVQALASVAQTIALGIERRQLDDARGRLAAILEATSDFVTIGRPEGPPLFANRAARAAFGIGPAEPVESLYEFRPPGFREFFERVVLPAAGRDGSWSGETEYVSRDGRVIPVSQVSVVHKDGGGITFISTISRDITGQKRASAERRTLEGQFQQAQKMEAVGRLAGGVAHDFNNLLTAILGYCELLLADLDPHDPRQADIREIQKAGRSAAGLTRQLLAFSRKEIIEPTVFDLNMVVAGIRGMLGRLIGEDVQIVTDLSPGPLPVHADRGQVEQVVMNLAVNARDAMANGGTLTIATAQIELDKHEAQAPLPVTPGPYVALTVSDTGTGMTPEIQARLFEPFFTTKETGKGTGLGLATVYSIVTQTGGGVAVSSEVGRGTAFTVYFPCAEAAEMALERPLPVARSRAGALTVLIVEDEAGLRELTRRMLQRLGYKVLVAANAEDAVRLFDETASIDVVLTDVVMPGASGPELIRQLVEKRPALKAIYMSGYTDEIVGQHGILRPGITFVHKPFTSEGLERKILEAFDRGRSVTL